MEYNYSSKTTSVDLDGINVDVASSTMTNKNIQGSSWHEDSTALKVEFDVSLSIDDKNDLDTIVTNNS